jgi:hypothetical protein
MTNETAASESIYLGTVPVDSGRVLLVDACHLPEDLLRALTTPNEHDVTLGVLAATPYGDGLFHIDSYKGMLIVDSLVDDGWHPAEA